jgi:hypothetical protein
MLLLHFCWLQIVIEGYEFLFVGVQDERAIDDSNLLDSDNEADAHQILHAGGHLIHLSATRVFYIGVAEGSP